MVRPILMFILFVLNASALAQVSFLEPDTAVWRFRGFVHDGPCFFHDWQYKLTNQDKTVGNYTYRKMLQLGFEQI